MGFLVLISSLFLVSCNVGERVGVDENSGYSQVTKEERDDRAIPKEVRVWVFKYDGSLQCGMGHAVSLETMKKGLGDIDIYSEEKRSDGLMRIQMCGSPTGHANLYQIDKKDLEKAKEKGFELWEFN